MAQLRSIITVQAWTIGMDAVTEALWGSAPPPSARVAVQTHVMRLRKVLGDGALIGTHRHGYELVVGEDELDVSQFEAHLAAARAAVRAGSWDAAAGWERAGLELWRGEPLADVESDLLTARDVPRLAELRLQAVEVALDAELRLGRHAEVITELRRLGAADPLRERLHGLLMLALYRDGRQAEALAAYARAQQVLVDELGAEPGAGLRQLQQQVLKGDPALDLAASDLPVRLKGTVDRAGPPVPRQLPSAVSGFTGRAAELAALARILDEADGGSPGTVVISAIGGTARFIPEHTRAISSRGHDRRFTHGAAARRQRATLNGHAHSCIDIRLGDAPIWQKRAFAAGVVRTDHPALRGPRTDPSCSNCRPGRRFSHASAGIRGA